jgi:flavin reductase (DIM6/NTAB) family NADH-FMN oxidoreductase RutF
MKADKIGSESGQQRTNASSNTRPSYSQFNNLTFDPPYVMFSANQDHLGERK